MSIWTEREHLPADFGNDADLEHEWAKRWRIPLVRSPYPRWRYEVALVVPDPSDVHELWHATWPTEEEAAVIGSLIDFRLTWYNERWRAKVREWPLDVDSGTNSLILIKRPDCWAYRRASFEGGPPTWPAYNNAAQIALHPPTKAGLVAIIASAWGGLTRYESDEPNDLGRWINERPEVWT